MYDKELKRLRQDGENLQKIAITASTRRDNPSLLSVQFQLAKGDLQRIQPEDNEYLAQIIQEMKKADEEDYPYEITANIGRLIIEFVDNYQVNK